MATTENSFNGTGSQDSFSFTFPYLKDTDIKVSVGGVVKTVTTHYTLHTPTTIKFTSGNIPASGTNNVRIYRETADTALQATFYPGSAIRSGDLNDNFTQNLYVTQESNNDSTLALNNSRESDGDGTYTSAIDKASAAVTTANTADTNATTAVNTANTASSTASTASSTATTASTNASNAVTTANAAKLSADRLVATTSDGGTTWTLAGNNTDASTDPKGVGYAVTQAEAAVTTANTANTTAASAVTTANGAVTTANTADGIADEAKLATDRLVATTSDGGSTWTLTGNNTNASTDPKGVGYAVTTAEAASATASAAQSAVANSVLYTPVADVASIPGTPSNDDYVEVTDSTGIESFSPLSGLPSGFTGDSGLTVKLRYTSSGTTWNYQSYHTNDAEDRYVAIYGKHNTTQVNYTVKVVTKTAAHRYHGSGSSDGFTIGGIEAPFLTLIPGNVYRFDQSDSSNSGHPIAFYRNSDKTGQWTDDVSSTGTPGQVGAYTDLTVTDQTPQSLSYQSTNDAYMGNGLSSGTGAGAGGATGGGSDALFLEYDQVMTADWTIGANKNALTYGPISINNGVTLTIPSTSKLLVLN